MRQMHSERSGGFTLIEVMVSLVILGVGVLALTQLFWFSSASALESLNRTRAHVHAVDMGERLWLDLTDPDATVDAWEAAHESALPGWEATVTADDASDPNFYTVTIAWTGTSAGFGGSAEYLIRTPTVTP